MSIESKVYLDLARIWNVGPGEVEKIVRDYIGAVTCDLKSLQPYPKPHIYIRPVKIKTLKERLEETKMNATSVQVINNIKDMSVTIEKSVLEETKIIISVSTDDDTYEINCSGPGCVEFLRKKDFVPIKEYEYVQNKLMEREKEIRELKQQLQKAERDKKSLAGSYERLDNCYKGLLKDHKNLIKCKESLKSDLDLERAANEAQHKFFMQYAGKGTEVQFNYAIDDVKEVSYVIVDKEEYNKNFEKWSNAQVEQDCNKNTREYILDQAKKCVCGQREQDYGTPESNFQLIADLWNGYLGKERLGREKAVVDGVDVAMMMSLMKIARIRNGGGSGDSFVDLAGYAACGGEIWAGQKHQKDLN